MKGRGTTRAPATYEAIAAAFRAHLAAARDDRERRAVALTWDGYRHFMIVGGPMDYTQWSRPLRDLIRPHFGGQHPPMIYHGPEEEEDRDVAAVAAERKAAGERHDPEGYRKSYWVLAAPIRTDLRLAGSDAERREIALMWSGYVVAMAGTDRIPPGDEARLMGEIGAHLRPGDPWEAIARRAGLDPGDFAPITEAARLERRRAAGVLTAFEGRIADLVARSANEDRGPSGNVIVDLSPQEGLTEAVAAEGARRAFALDAEAQARGERPLGPLRRLEVIGPDLDVVYENPAPAEA